MHVMNDELIDLIKEHSTLKCWNVEQGFGTFITLELGERREATKRDGSKTQEGSYRLWLYMSSWDIFFDNGLVVSFEEYQENRSPEKLSGLLGRSVTDIYKDSNNIVISLSGKTRILLSPFEDSGEEDDYFILFFPEGKSLSYNRSNGFYLESE